MPTLYRAYNGIAPTTVGPVRVTTGTALKTMLQIAPPSTKDIEIVEWGISFAGTTASDAPVQCELVETDVAATVTAHVAAGIIRWGVGGADSVPSALVAGVSTTTTGYTASAEGTIAAARLFDYVDLTPYGGVYRKEFSLGARPVVSASKFLRVRVLAAAAVTAITFVTWAE